MLASHVHAMLASHVHAMLASHVHALLALCVQAMLALRVQASARQAQTQARAHAVFALTSVWSGGHSPDWR